MPIVPVQSYDAKADEYFGGVREDIVARLPDNPSARILEVGCARGGTGALALERGKCAEYVGVELHEPSASEARSRLTDVLAGDIEAIDLPFPPESFDAVIASEVFEHLVDPWKVVEKLARHLKPGGLFFASSPNISHYRVIGQLIRGRWRHTDVGVMDRTHLRWFTPEAYAKMFIDAGFEIRSIGPLVPSGGRVRMLNALTRNAFRHVFWVQIDLMAQKK